MSTYTTNLRLSNADVTIFKAWAQGLGAVLAATGWTQTSDTGQIVWANVLSTPAINSYSGYEIYRKTGDTLDSSTPVYMKLEYGATSSATVSAIRLTIGSATDGAGNLTGMVTTPQVMAVGSAIASATQVDVCYGDGHYVFAWRMITASAGGCIFFCVDRTRDANGAVTSDGVNLWTRYQNVVQQQSLRIASPQSTYSSLGAWMGMLPPGTFTTWSMGSDTLVTPIYPIQGNLGNPTIGFISGLRDDFLTSDVTFTMDLYGTSRTWKIEPLHFGGTIAGNNYGKTIILWE